MMKIMDLSGTIESGLWTYGPPNPPVELKQLASLSRDGYAVSSINMSILTGSYFETGAHLLEGRPNLDELSCDRFITTATVLQLPKAELEPIRKEDLMKHEDRIYGNKTLIIGTGWDRFWNTGSYMKKGPYFTPEAIEWLTQTPVNLLGADIPTYNDPRGTDINVLDIFYQKTDNAIIAPLVNVTKITSAQVQLIAAPLKLKDLCAAPCRILAIQQD